MSQLLVEAVLDSELEAHPKFILTVMAMSVKDDGLDGRLGVADIARACSLTPELVRVYLTTLRQKGIVQPTPTGWNLVPEVITTFREAW